MARIVLTSKSNKNPVTMASPREAMAPREVRAAAMAPREARAVTTPRRWDSWR